MLQRVRQDGLDSVCQFSWHVGVSRTASAQFVQIRRASSAAIGGRGVIRVCASRGPMGGPGGASRFPVCPQSGRQASGPVDVLILLLAPRHAGPRAICGGDLACRSRPWLGSHDTSIGTVPLAGVMTPSDMRNARYFDLTGPHRCRTQR